MESWCGLGITRVGWQRHFYRVPLLAYLAHISKAGLFWRCRLLDNNVFYFHLGNHREGIGTHPHLESKAKPNLRGMYHPC